MTREEAINEINKVFTPAYANYIVTALTEGATVSDIQHRWGRAYEAGVKDGLEQEPKWIPVTERLPKEHLCNDGYIEPSDYVLVWGDHGSYGVSRYWGNRRSKSERPDTYRDWTDLEWVVEKPIAWMPLPKPYKAESEEI